MLQQSGWSRAETHGVIEPGVLPVELRAHPFVEVPVEAQRHLGCAARVERRIGEARRTRCEYIVADAQARHPRHCLPGAVAGQRMTGIEIVDGCNRFAVARALLPGKQVSAKEV